MSGWEIRPLGVLVIAVLIGIAVYFVVKKIRNRDKQI
jgi:hypothetical protein